MAIIFDETAQATPEYKALQQEVKKCAENAFGRNGTVPWDELKLPFLDAGQPKKIKYEGYEKGRTFIQPWTKSKPGIVDPRNQEIIDPSEIWAGQLVRATVKPFSYNAAGNRGVSFALNNVQIVKTDMPRIDGRTKATEDFDPIDGALADEGGDDDIPF